MHPFGYTTADTEAHARAELVKGAHAIAGGTTLVDLMKLDIERPARVVDITTLPLAEVTTMPDGTVRVGALVRNSDMAEHVAVKEGFPAVSQALLAGASPQLRNMATTGGNLLQRTRCWYFRDSAITACNKRTPGSGCAAIDGLNRIHAVLGTSASCIATHASDLCVALAAFDAGVRVRGVAGERVVPFGEFHLEPGAHPERETVLAPGELITAVDLPPLRYARRSVYLKVRDRASYSFALASAAVALDIEAGTVREARIALGGIATKPWRARDAERALTGRRAGLDAYRQIADDALRGAIPRAHNAFKIALAKRTLIAALQQAEALS